jgi:hypothetical protein
MPWGYTINQAIRKHQCEDDTFGTLYAALYLFVDRTSEEFFWDLPEYLEPALSLEQCEGVAFYSPKDGFCFPDRINLNPWRHKDGEDMADSLAHELTHMWQAKCGLEVQHDRVFIDRLAMLGLVANADGAHTHCTARWPAWLEENADLNLAAYLLPGGDPTATGPELAHVHTLGLWCAACNVLPVANLNEEEGQ